MVYVLVTTVWFPQRICIKIYCIIFIVWWGMNDWPLDLFFCYSLSYLNCCKTPIFAKWAIKTYITGHIASISTISSPNKLSFQCRQSGLWGVFLWNSPFINSDSLKPASHLLEKIILRTILYSKQINESLSVQVTILGYIG